MSERALQHDPDGARKWAEIQGLAARVALGERIRLLCECRHTRRPNAEECQECHCEPLAVYIEHAAGTRRHEAIQRAGEAATEAIIIMAATEAADGAAAIAPLGKGSDGGDGIGSGSGGSDGSGSAAAGTETERTAAPRATTRAVMSVGNMATEGAGRVGGGGVKTVSIDRHTDYGNPFKGPTGAWLDKRLRDAVCNAYEEYIREPRNADVEGIARRHGVEVDGRLRGKEAGKALHLALQRLEEQARELSEGQTIRLMCHCHPKRCHGDSIVRVIRDRLRARGKATEGGEKAATAATASVLASRLLDRLVPMSDIASDEEVARQERGGSTSEERLERRGSTSEGAAAATTTDGGEVLEGSDGGGLGEDDGGQSEEPKKKKHRSKGGKGHSTAGVKRTPGNQRDNRRGLS